MPNLRFDPTSQPLIASDQRGYDFPRRKSLSRRRRFLGVLRTVALAFAMSATSWAGQTFYVSVTGDDTTGNGSVGSPWRTLKKACLQVAADQGNTIQLGVGIFEDPERLTGNTSRAVLPKGVNLVGAGRTQTTYLGEIYVPAPGNQNISDFFIDGRENTTAAAIKFQGLIIQDTSNIQASNVHVFNMRIEGFYSKGLQFGFWSGLKNSSLHDCELVNNGKHNARGWGLSTGNLVDVEIYNNVFLEQRGTGGEPWNSGMRVFTNVKFHHNHFTTHNDNNAGWNGQVVFNFEWWKVDCLNVEIYENRFDGSLSLIDADKPRTNKTPYSIRVYNNRWEYTKRYGIEMGMHYMEIDHNYFHFGISSDRDVGVGYAAIAYFSSNPFNHIGIHHNVFDNVPLYVLHGLNGDNVRIQNNTALAGRPGQVPNSWASATTRFFNDASGGDRSNWSIVNNVFDCDPARPGIFFSLKSTSPDPTNTKVMSNVTNNATSGVGGTFADQPDVVQPVAVNPLFVLNGEKPFPYYSLSSNSPLVDAGSLIPGITDGFFGAGPDIGAFESGSATPATNLLSEGFENGTLNFTSSASIGTNKWVVTQTYKRTGSFSAFCSGPSTRSLTTLTTPDIVIPPGSTGLKLSFWHRYVFQVNDAAVMEVSINGGTWTDVTATGSGASVVSGGYTGTVGGTGNSKNYNPLFGRQGWTGTRADFAETVVEFDAATYANKTMRLRWQLGTDNSTASEGWYLDDILLQAIVPPTPPVIVQAAAAAQSPVTGTSVALSVRAQTTTGNLVYTWKLNAGAPAAVSFSANGTAAAKDTVATFVAPGTYQFVVTVANTAGLKVESAVSVVVARTLVSLDTYPAEVELPVGSSQQFAAEARDQFDSPMGVAPAWSVSAGQTISSGALLTAGLAPGGPYTVTAQSSGLSATSSVMVRGLTYSEWEAKNFPSTGQLPVAGDFDGDGIPNLMEYALGSDPGRSDAAKLPKVGTMTQGSDEFLTLTFVRPVSLTQISYVAESATALGASPWTPVPLEVIASDGIVETVRARDNVPVAGSNRRFLRLRVDQSGVVP